MFQELKCWPSYFEELWAGTKLFEVRKNDRNYTRGDHLLLMEWDPDTEKYSGRSVRVEVTYLLPGGRLGIADDYCVMSLKILERNDARLPMERRWLIWSNEHGAWWRRNARGYTPYKEEAGRYNFDEACEIVKDANYYPGPKKKAVPKETMVLDEWKELPNEHS